MRVLVAIVVGWVFLHPALNLQANDLFTLVLNAATNKQFRGNDAAIVLVNGNPAFVTREKSFLLTINQFIHNGTNRFAVSDPLDREWKMELVKAKGNDTENVALRRTTSKSGQTEYEASLSSVPSNSLFAANLLEPKTDTNSVCAFYQKLIKLVVENKAEAKKVIIEDGASIWQKQMYGASAADLQTSAARAEQWLASATTVLEEVPCNRLRIVVGPQLALLYGGFIEEDTGPRPYLARFKDKDGDSIPFPPLFLYKSASGWKVWQ